MPALSDNTLGALFMVCAMCAYTFNDAFMKALSDEIPLFQAIFLRGVGAALFLAIMCRMLGQLRFALPARDWGFVLLRTAGEVGGTYSPLQHASCECECDFAGASAECQPCCGTHTG